MIKKEERCRMCVDPDKARVEICGPETGGVIKKIICCANKDCENWTPKRLFPWEKPAETEGAAVETVADPEHEKQEKKKSVAKKKAPAKKKAAKKAKNG